MHRTWLPVSLCACMLSPACSTDDGPGTHVSLRDGGLDAQVVALFDAASDVESDGGRVASCAPIPISIWKSTSTRIELTSFGYFQGSSGYAAERSQLSTAQLAALEQLCAIEPEVDGLVASDALTLYLTIRDVDGSAATYAAVRGDSRLDPLGPPARQLLFGSLAAFRVTFQCLSASDSRDSHGAFDDAGTLAHTPALGTDPSCLNGVFQASHCDPTWLELAVDHDEPLTLSAGAWFGRAGCVSNLQIAVFDESAAVLLAESVPEPDAGPPTCTSLGLRLDAGTYLVQLSRRFGDVCLIQDVGDYALRISAP